MLKLRNYQEAALAWFKVTRRGYFAAKAGAGKTAVVWRLIDFVLNDAFEPGPAIVIAPRNVAPQWPQERAKWGVAPFLRVVEYKGTPGQRQALRQALKTADVIIVAFEFAHELQKLVPRPSVVVWDEASRLRSGGRQGSKAWKTVNNWSRMSACRIVLMSGSPLPTSPEDVYAPVFLLDRGAALGRTLTEFRDTWLVPDKKDRSSGQVFSWKLAPGKQQAFFDAVKHLYFAVAPDLGLKYVEVDRMVTLPARVAKAYHQLADDQVLKLGYDSIIAASQGVLCQKLHQMAQGSVKNEDGGAVHLHDAKLDELETILGELGDDKAVVVAWYQQDFERLKARLPEAVKLDTPVAIQEAKEGKLGHVLLHPASAGHGLDGLQQHYSVLIWFAVHWSQELYEQTLARIVRTGQRETVRVFRILAEDTIDTHIAHKVLPRKAERQEAFFDANKRQF
jgi:hypothetical protein